MMDVNHVGHKTTFWQWALKPRSLSLRLALAFLILVMGGLLTWSIHYWIEEYIAAIVLGTAVIISTFCGKAIGFASVLILASVSDYYFIPPIGVFNSIESYIHFFVIIGLTCVTNWIIGSLKSMIEVNQKLYLAQKEKEKLLADAVSARDNFIGIASHELKTPLTSMTLMLGIYRDKVKKKDQTLYTPQFLEKSFSLLEDQTRRLTILVTDMLDVTRISTGKFKTVFAMIDVSDMVEKLLETLNVQCKTVNKECQFRIQKEVFAHIDKFRIEQAITNLMSNAFKYGTAPITLTVFTDYSHLVISVKDSGPGIPLDQQAKLFKKYTLLKETGGLGLGLYITKQIVEAHHGTISLLSNELVGSDFIIRLPLTQPTL